MVIYKGKLTHILLLRLLKDILIALNLVQLAISNNLTNLIEIELVDISIYNIII